MPAGLFESFLDTITPEAVKPTLQKISEPIESICNIVGDGTGKIAGTDSAFGKALEQKQPKQTSGLV
eukprot:CAMPEP_0175860224 /NCGR_PEP_ID=MMETSP0107_2-20121207/30699_1 /TAXON_ID=195067 ORGANISM="Goniomonas pacifica, Strain CCMP1869" /NCGR_SAMPLE_ID=MMETSP0107_2 /ASSEMBLY_ACC=CAM_ASM_000203 /LENGTH=66 /DNA_ID=CAMNT_0017176945 /DNA_START=19 /DNA_END=219 /DNA_ORIENTATION=+